MDKELRQKIEKQFIKSTETWQFIQVRDLLDIIETQQKALEFMLNNSNASPWQIAKEAITETNNRLAELAGG